MECLPLTPINSIVDYPFDVELGLNTDDGVAIVDVGGDCGQLMKTVRANFPALQGRIIVQDLKETIGAIEDSTSFEPMVHDFFEPQPVRDKRHRQPPDLPIQC